MKPSGTLSTRTAVAGLQTAAAVDPASPAQRVVDVLTGWLARRTSRRGFLVRTGLVASAVVVDTSFLIRPGTAYATVCGPGTRFNEGWTVFCATVNNGVNACPPGTLAAGWWKAQGASLCGGKARYIVDCNATCTCSDRSGRPGICSPSCWSCRCTRGPAGQCDRRRVCCNAFRYGQCNQQVRQVGAIKCRVVSCTPPWQFEKCSTAPATDNTTRNHSSPSLPAAFTVISRRYVALGENGSVLGASVYGEVRVAGGSAQRYQRGRISSGRSGTFETVGPISRRFADLGAEAGPLGFPVAPPIATRRPGGSASRFENGRISSLPATGTHETRGPIATAYLAEGAEDGRLGFPTSGERTVTPGVRRNTFERGSISFDDATRQATVTLNVPPAPAPAPAPAPTEPPADTATVTT